MYGYFPKKTLLKQLKGKAVDVLCWAGACAVHPFLKKKFFAGKIKRILVTRWCCIGDILQTTPLVRALRKAFPDATIDYMTGSWSKPVLEKNPYINSIIDYASQKFFPQAKEKALLRETAYDAVFVCDDSLPPTILAMATGARYRIGFNAYNRGFLLTHSVKRSFDDSWHLINAYLELAHILGIQDNGTEMDLFLTKEEIAGAKELMRKKGVPDGRRIVCLFPGGASNPGSIMPSKRWSPQRYAHVADVLSRELGAAIVVMGAKSDEEVIKELREAARSETTCIVGETALRQSAALFKQCDLFIGNDTGPLHMAAAVGTPTICLFGPSDPSKHAPLGSKHVGLRADIDCPPCIRITIGGSAICPDVPCMSRLTEEHVIQAARKLLS